MMGGGDIMKKIFYTLMFAMPAMLNSTKALAQDDPFGLGDVDTELGEKDLKESISAIINVILGFLGILATVIILLGGFKWMTSQGNSEKVDEAKNLIKNGIIGLVIIFSAFAISSFVISSMFEATSE